MAERYDDLMAALRHTREWGWTPVAERRGHQIYTSMFLGVVGRHTKIPKGKASRG